MQGSEFLMLYTVIRTLLQNYRNPDTLKHICSIVIIIIEFVLHFDTQTDKRNGQVLS